MVEGKPEDYIDLLPEDVMAEPHGLDLSQCRTVSGDNEHCGTCSQNLPLPFDASKVVTLGDLWMLIDKWMSERPCDHKFIEEIYFCEGDNTQLLISFGS